jgi:hypothetical protein
MTISGTEILARTISKPTVTDKHGNIWNYHGRSDHHSKVACWSIVFDLMRTSRLLREHVAEGRVGFGINVEINDFQNDRSKDLDLVICQPATQAAKRVRTLSSLADHWKIELSKKERADLDGLPLLRENSVGGVLVALEAKACMTAHQRALPRLYDELNSSHLTVHGAHDLAIAAGFVMINSAERFLSPDLNKGNRVQQRVWSEHDQPKSVEITIDKVKQLPRRSRTGIPGYDALAIVVVDCANDGSPVSLQTGPPAPQPADTYHYASMIDRLAAIYAVRFAQI